MWQFDTLTFVDVDFENEIFSQFVSRSTLVRHSINSFAAAIEHFLTSDNIDSRLNSSSPFYRSEKILTCLDIDDDNVSR